MYATWDDAAREYARRAYEEWFFFDWGIEPIACSEALCIFNNAMSLNSLSLRKRQLSEFRAELPMIGVSELAYAEFPGSESEGHHSYALVLDASEEQLRLISDAYEKVVGSCGRHHRKKASNC